MPSRDPGRVHVFGIRHHGPGSARSLLHALERLSPDVLLVEGPPDADSALSYVGHADLRPPVALVVYPVDAPSRGVFYPFGSFSPEWNALRFAQARGIPARFCDLPLSVALADVSPEHPAAVDGGRPTDPIRLLAEAAGEADPERWWERLVEQRGDSAEVFEAVAEAMTAVREALPETSSREAQREAYMRQAIRQAEREGFQRIAVVCGAWHVPALAAGAASATADERLLRGLKRVKTAATWIPWTTARLAFESGYGAGVESPAWYRHLWESEGSNLVGWLSRAARLLREEDLDASPAQVVEAVRMAEALAALRGRPQPSLSEATDAALAVICHGDDVRLRLVRRKLIVGDEIGSLPAGVPTVPLQRDLDAQARRLRLKPDTEPRTLNLDLRQEAHLGQSRLLYQLRLLGIQWGQVQRGPFGAQGTFREVWTLRWRPEMALEVVEASVYGSTLAAAATGKVRERAAQAADVGELADLLDLVLLAGLAEAVPPLVAMLGERAAEATDVSQLLRALPPLAATLRYGDVRRTDTRALDAIVQGMAQRAMVGLAPACAGADEETAAGLAGEIGAASRAFGVLEHVALQDDWWRTLRRLLDTRDLAPRIAGTCGRLLLDAGQLTDAEAADYLARALARGTEPAAAAAWIEGFLQGSGLLLATSKRLFDLVDQWLCSLSAEHFPLLLPLLRRTTSTFSAGERRQVAERVRGGGLDGVLQVGGELDEARAGRVEPLVLAILGLSR